MGSLPVWSNSSNIGKFSQFGLRSLAAVPKAHTFREARAALIEGASRGELFRIVEGNYVLLDADFCFGVTVRSPHLWAQIIGDGSVGQQNPRETARLVYDNREQKAKPSHLGQPDLFQERTISFRTLRLLGSLIATGKE